MPVHNFRTDGNCLRLSREITHGYSPESTALRTDATTYAKVLSKFNAKLIILIICYFV